MRMPLLPTASDLAILAGALWESHPARVVQAAVLMLPAIGVILAIAVAAELGDRLHDVG